MKNTTIFKRLLGYLKAYRLRLFFVLLSAVISTAFRRVCWIVNLWLCIYVI